MVMILSRSVLAGALSLLPWLAAPSVAAPFSGPPALSSQNGRLDVLMIAAQRKGVRLGDVSFDPWTYEICRLPAPGANACPPGQGASGLGGTRLALQPGDTMRVRLVNKLPPIDPNDSDHVADEPTLLGNPTNLHMHGFIVEPHRSARQNDPYGDYVFLELRNPANPIPSGASHPGVDVVLGAAEYLYQLDPTHPSGLYYYHPHQHGLALNQLTAGLYGPVTIGSVADVCGNLICRLAVENATVRHLVLSDTQVLAGGKLKTQEEPNFCLGAPAAPRQGRCAGQWFDPSDPGSNYLGGTWLHTVSGQVYPSIAVGGQGDVWRVFAASGSRSYALSLVDAATGDPLPMQVLSLDGVTIETGAHPALADLQRAFGRKLRLMRCPGQAAPGDGGPVCAATLYMMPSSRVDVRIVGADPGHGTTQAVFRTAEFDTGDDGNGDQWPQIDLAAVSLAPRGPVTPAVIPLGSVAAALFAPTGQLLGPLTLRVPGTGTVLPYAAAAQVAPGAGPAVQDVALAPTVAITPGQLAGRAPVPNCARLAPGRRRRIYFGYPTPTTFGLAYVEVDGLGNEIEATRTPIAPFDPASAMICVSLAGGHSATEVWELVNTSNEDHNFHIHQTKFYLVSGGLLPGQFVPSTLPGTLVLHDNVPVPRGLDPAGCDGTVAAVKSGACRPSVTTVVIPFRELGDFVFHCHIFEHEDGGMMARIRVVAGR